MFSCNSPHPSSNVITASYCDKHIPSVTLFEKSLLAALMFKLVVI